MSITLTSDSRDATNCSRCGWPKKDHYTLIGDDFGNRSPLTSEECGDMNWKRKEKSENK